MALTLTAGIDEDATTLEVTGEVPAEIAAGYLFRLDDEVLKLVGFDHIPPVRTWPVDRNRWIIQRGALGTAPAAHSEGADVLAVVDAYLAGPDEEEPGPFPGGVASNGSGLAFATDSLSEFATIAQGAATFTSTMEVTGAYTPDEIGNTWKWVDLRVRIVVNTIADGESADIGVDIYDAPSVATTDLNGYVPFPNRIYPFLGTIAGEDAAGYIDESGTVRGFDGSTITDVLQVNDEIRFSITGTVTND